MSESNSSQLALVIVQAVLWAMGVISFVFLPLNMLSGIVSGIWFVALGEWGLLFSALIAVIAMPFVFTILLLPALGIGALGIWFIKRENYFLLGVTTFVAGVYNYGLMGAWSILVYQYVAALGDRLPSVPVLLLGHAVMSAPLTYMASKEPQSEGLDATVLAVFFAQLVYLSCSIQYFVGGKLSSWIWPVALFGLFLCAISAYIACLLMKEDHGLDYSLDDRF